MTYPQTSSKTEVLEAQEFYRLYTEMVSSGDIYEVVSSVRAFAIGPQSDIARVRITYYDESMPNKYASFVVSVGNPWVGQIDATPDNPILVSIEDLVNNGFNSGGGATNVNPRLDLLCYLASPTQLPAKRADYIMRGVAEILGGSLHSILIPYYRRKYASIKVKQTTGFDLETSADGISFLSGPNDSAFVISDVLATQTLASGGNAEYTIKASSKGMFDALRIEMDLSGGGSADGQAPGVATVFYEVLCTDEEV